MMHKRVQEDAAFQARAARAAQSPRSGPGKPFCRVCHAYPDGNKLIGCRTGKSAPGTPTDPAAASGGSSGVELLK